MRSEPKLQNFSDYRVFLQLHAQEMKKRKPTWSYGVWSKTLGLKTTSSITKVINGQREPGQKMTEKMITYFRFTEKQAQYFRDLVRLEKLKNDPRLSLMLMEKMGKDFPNSSLRTIDDRSFLVISNWYYLALRELCRAQGFIENPEWIAEKFLFKVTAREIAQAIKTSIDLKLLSRDEAGNLQIVDGRIDTKNDIASEAIKRYHEQMLEHAKLALRQIAVERREITSTSLLMSSNQIGLAKELIREFKVKFEQILENEDGDQVVQLQIQMFPLTKQITHEEVI